MVHFFNILHDRDRAANRTSYSIAKITTMHYYYSLHEFYVLETTHLDSKKVVFVPFFRAFITNISGSLAREFKLLSGVLVDTLRKEEITYLKNTLIYSIIYTNYKSTTG